MLESMSDLLTTGEAARVLEVSESTIRLWDRNGRLSARRTAGKQRVFDATTYARVSVASISRAVRTGRLRAYRIAGGRAVRLHRDDVDAWLRTHLTGVERVLKRGR